AADAPRSWRATADVIRVLLDHGAPVDAVGRLRDPRRPDPAGADGRGVAADDDPLRAFHPAAGRGVAGDGKRWITSATTAMDAPSPRSDMASSVPCRFQRSKRNTLSTAATSNASAAPRAAGQ